MPTYCIEPDEDRMSELVAKFNSRMSQLLELNPRGSPPALPSQDLGGGYSPTGRAILLG